MAGPTGHHLESTTTYGEAGHAVRQGREAGGFTKTQHNAAGWVIRQVQVAQEYAFTRF